MPGIQYIYTFSGDRTLRRFNPEVMQFESVGILACQSSSPFSMAVDRSGQAWVEYADTGCKVMKVGITLGVVVGKPAGSASFNLEGYRISLI